jgi:hypothetical protein
MMHKQHRTAMTRELLQQQILMNIVACQAIRREDHELIVASLPDGITQGIQTRAFQSLTTRAAVGVNIARLIRVAFLLSLVIQGRQLAIDALLACG